ncbi:MAG: hypothetical protein RL701_5478, partial [Pseudomonadota bacterium]
MQPEPEALEPYANWPDPFVALTSAQAQTDAVCARGGDDPVRDIFCNGAPPAITGIRALELALKLDPANIRGFSGVSVTAHSTALSARSVSALNPRVIVQRLEQPPVSELLALSFVRGEQFCELIVRDRSEHDLRFYLLHFKQPCNDAANGCMPGDLLSETAENDWRELALYDERSVA